MEEVVCEWLCPYWRRFALGVSILFQEQVRHAVFIPHEGRVNRPIWFTHDWPVVGERSFHSLRCRCGDTEWPTALASHVVHQNPAVIIYQLGGPEATCRPLRLMWKYRPGRRPVTQIRRAIKRKLRRPVSRCAGRPILRPDSNNCRVGVIAWNHRIRSGALQLSHRHSGHYSEDADRRTQSESIAPLRNPAGRYGKTSEHNAPFYLCQTSSGSRSTAALRQDLLAPIPCICDKEFSLASQESCHKARAPKRL